MQSSGLPGTTGRVGQFRDLTIVVSNGFDEIFSGHERAGHHLFIRFCFLFIALVLQGHPWCPLFGLVASWGRHEEHKEELFFSLVAFVVQGF